MRRRGFSLIEVMLVVALVALLATIAITEFSVVVMLARRTNGVIGLQHVWDAQKAYAIEKGEFASTFEALGFTLEGGQLLDAVTYRSGPYTYQLSQPWGSTSFYCIATAQLDGDPYPDILEVFETNTEGQ